MTETKSKKETLLELLERGKTMLHLDARHEALSVPTHLKDDYHLRINLSYRFGLTDLEITDEKISTTLSFQGAPFYCHFPMDALWGLSQPDLGIQMFPDSIPQEFVMELLAFQPEVTPADADLAKTDQEPDSDIPPHEGTPFRVVTSAPAFAKQPTSKTSAKRPALRLVVDQDEDQLEGEAETSAPTPRPQLRIVKDDN